jgi:hypothetical protein
MDKTFTLYLSYLFKVSYLVPDGQWTGLDLSQYQKHLYKLDYDGQIIDILTLLLSVNPVYYK